MNKKILAFFLALSMIISCIPALAITAEATDLIHDNEGNLKEGVFVTNSGGEYGQYYALSNVVNNADNDRWGSVWVPSAPAWVQLNLPIAKQMTEIVITGAWGDHANPFKVLASNDADFTESTVLLEHSTAYPADRKFVINDAEKLATPYRYIRVVTTHSSNRFGIAEIDVRGIDEELPDVSADTVLTDNADIIAYASGEYGAAYVAQRALDGDESSFYFVSGVEKPAFTLDLRRGCEISKIGFISRKDADYTASRSNYEIQVSNDPTFATYDVLYKRLENPTKLGEWTYCYGKSDQRYRYVRIQNTAASGQQAIAEVKVWGNETSNSSVIDLAKTATVTTTTQSNLAYTTIDGNITTGWSCADETGKAAITYTFGQPSVVTSFQIYPVYDKEDDTKRKNINVYASASGNFNDAVLLKSISSEPLLNGRYNAFTLENFEPYKAIKLESMQEPTPASGLGIMEMRLVYDSTGLDVTVESTSPADGQTNVSNMGDTTVNLIEVELNRTVTASSVNPTNVKIKNITDNTYVTSWTPYEVSGKKFSIDICNLLSNKEYEVTLTTGVKAGGLPLTEEYKFTFTTGVIIRVPYVPGKVLVNVLKDKEITGNANANYNPISAVVDGNESTFAVSSGGPAFSIDLGNIYDIVAVELVPQGGENNKILLQGMNVLASKEYVDFKNVSSDTIDATTIATYPSTSSKKEIITFASPVKARYLGLNKSSYIVICEFKAYAYVDKNFGQWSVKNGTVAVDAVTDAGTYTFSIPVQNLDTDADTDYYMIVSAYDENGKMLYKDSGVVTATKNTTTELTKTLTVDAVANVSEITAVLVKSTRDGEMFIDAKTIYKTKPLVSEVEKPSTTITSLSDAVKFTVENDGFIISGMAYNEGYIKPSDRINVQVLEPKSDKSGYDFETISSSDFASKLCYAKAKGMFKEAEEFKFSFKVKDPSAYGEYSIKLTLTKEDGTTETLNKYIVYLAETDINDCVSAFKNFTASDSMESLLNTWSTTKKYFTTSQLVSGLDIESVPAGFNIAFERLCDLYDADGNMTDVLDVVDCLNAAYILSMIESENTTSVKTALSEYKGNITGLYDKSVINADKYVSMYTVLKSNITDSTSLKKVMNWTKALSFIQNGTREDVQFAIENYYEILGCDLSYATSKNVVLDDAVMKIDVQNASAYYDNFATTFTNAVDAVVAERSNIGGSSSPGGGGGIPPVRVPAATTPVTPTPDANDKEETPVKPSVPSEEKMPFSDIENILWAKEHIKALYDKGIISGDGDGKFHPERNVSREEFLKMLIEALEINYVSDDIIMFEDCSLDAWYYSYVKIALTNKITSGIDENNFGVGKNIKRQDMAVLVSKALSVKSITADETQKEFNDETNISKYALSDVKRMCTLGIINGFEDGTFAPDAYTTRAQAAVIIGRVLEIIGGVAE